MPAGVDRVKSHSEADFLRWAAARGIEMDARYPRSAILRFREHSDDGRFWCVPDAPERRPYFILSLLELMGSWHSCHAWRHRGSWPLPEHSHPNRINDFVEIEILKGIGMPLGTADVIEFDRAELHRLVTLLFSTTIFGWSVGQDLYIAPDHGRCILKVSHHAVVHVDFRPDDTRANDIAAWVSSMAERGFPLPEEPPDETFKRPSWM